MDRRSPEDEPNGKDKPRKQVVVEEEIDLRDPQNMDLLSAELGPGTPFDRLRQMILDNGELNVSRLGLNTTTTYYMTITFGNFLFGYRTQDCWEMDRSDGYIEYKTQQTLLRFLLLSNLASLLIIGLGQIEQNHLKESFNTSRQR